MKPNLEDWITIIAGAILIVLFIIEFISKIHFYCSF